MLQRGTSYESIYADFRWRIPPRYNMGVDACDRHAARTPEATALIFEDETGRVARYRFRDIQQHSNRLANVLKANGVGPGERFAILLPQSPETAIAHIAAYKSGVIAVPLFVLFGQ